MAFAGNPILICQDEAEFVERPEDGSASFKAGELVYTQRSGSPGYLHAVAAPNSATVKILGQVQTDSTGTSGTKHKVQLITPETDIEIVTSAIMTQAYEGMIYENIVATANVHTLNLSGNSYPTYYVKRALRVNPDRVNSAFDTRAVVRVLAACIEGLV